MELRGEDGSVVELCERVEKELGRGPGFAPHDRTVSRRQVCLQVQRITASKDLLRFRVSIQVIGPNPICVIHSNVGEGGNDEVEIAKSGTRSLLEIGDKFSLSIQEPVFYTLQEPVARVGLGPHPSAESGLQRNGSTDGGKLLELDQSDANEKRDEGERNERTEAGIAAADPDEEGIAEAVARWQRRRQERLQVQQRTSTQEGAAIGDRIGGEVGREREQAEGIISEQELVFSKHGPPETHYLGPSDVPRIGQDYADFVKEFGFAVEGSEFERYGKKACDTSKWDWQIGRRSANDSDEDEDEDEDEEGGGQVRHDQAGKRNRSTAGSKANQKANRANDDDDDDWRGDSEGERELLSAGKRSVPLKKSVQTRSHDFATSSETKSESRKKQKLVSTSENDPNIKTKRPEQGKTRVNPRQATASTSTKRSREEEEGEEEDDDGGDLDGFLVDDVEEEDEPEAADDEDEWTDEHEDEDEDEDEEAEEDEIDERKGKGNAQPAGHAPAPSRPAKDNELDQDDDKPLCKYGSKCFRKNKDHLAQFRH